MSPQEACPGGENHGRDVAGGAPAMFLVESCGLVSSPIVSSLAAECRRENVLAEGVGFEPTDPCESTVFKTAAFVHSATPPPGYMVCFSSAPFPFRCGGRLFRRLALLRSRTSPVYHVAEGVTDSAGMDAWRGTMPGASGTGTGADVPSTSRITVQHISPPVHAPWANSWCHNSVSRPLG